MSLLLDALKRAEQEKSARQTTAPAAEPPPRVAPVATAPAGPASPSKGMLELQPMAQAERDAHAARNADAREAAANLMQAKLPQAKPTSGKVVMILGIVGVVIVLIGAGVGYLWYAMQPPLRAAAPAAERKRAFVPQPIPSSPPPAVAGVDGPPPSIAMQADTARVTPIVAPTVEAKSAPEPSPATAAAPEAPRGDAESQQMLANLLQQAASPVAPPVKFARTERAATVLPELRSAYAALAQGDLATARRGYLAVLGADAANFDALLGMATVDARLGNREGARAYYRKVLEIDPRNGVALAGLAAIAQAIAPDAVESQLRADLARDPESAALHSTLGGLYASQSRWGEAQAQYFDAYRLEPGSADIAFNLAVSLDHLGQAKAAAQYYGRALQAARAAAAQFDVAAARHRMAELAP